MAISVLAGVFTGNNQSGKGRLVALGSTPRYNRFPSKLMLSMGIHQDLSSATVYSSLTADATLILFRSPLPSLVLPEYSGNFLQITNRKGSSSELDVNSFSPYGFNNMATSMLAVAPWKGSEYRVSFRDIFLTKWISIIDKKLPSEAKRDGEPLLTWEMWPTNVSGLSSTKCYLRIHQPLDIELHCWPDYKASITYHVYLYLDGNDKVCASVARSDYWIESGAKHSDIKAQLAPAVKSGQATLNAELDKKLDEFKNLTFSEIYFLPGKQTSRPPTGVLLGSTFSDVTIVLVF
jgi:hypothetical protein